MASMTESRFRHLPGRRRRRRAVGDHLDRRRRQGPPRPAAVREPGADGVHPPGPVSDRCVASDRSPAMAATTRLGPNYRKLFAATTISNLGDGVGVIAYPWLASAITRNPLLIALVGVVQRLPWLLFTLPAGVITDRNDRRRLMVGANAVRAVLTAAMAVAVLVRQDVIAAPDEIEQVVGTEWFLYVIDPRRDAAARDVRGALRQQRPDVHAGDRRHRAPRAGQRPDVLGRDRRQPVPRPAARQPAAGRPGSCCRSCSTPARSPSRPASCSPSSPPSGRRRPTTPPSSAGRSRTEMAEGFRWLWHHALLRTFAIALGCLNLLGNMSDGRHGAVGPGGPAHLDAASSACCRRAAPIGGVRGRLAGVGDHQAHRLRARRSA